ncbi:hypothetical protein CCMA1212_007967 [Trichoderma ghanense]|uniref:CFEM domain-containing protein n=1 Tax=Trichoderma ghanense TaxID=65468 RepID=A0ABY2GYF9_9HYPO
MKASVLSLVFLSGLAAAQIPDCATGCVTKFTTGTSIAGCGQLDIACICKNADFLNGIACCLTTACDKDGQAQAVKYAKQICSSAGVSTPDDVVCNESSSSATESATATDDSSTTATTGSSESTTAESSETTAADSSSSAPATTNSASRTTGSSATRASQTASSASQTSTNVAAPLASAGSLVGAAIAVLAAAL